MSNLRMVGCFWLVLLCLTPLSTIFQLHYGVQFYRVEETTNMSHYGGQFYRVEETTNMSHYGGQFYRVEETGGPGENHRPVASH